MRAQRGWIASLALAALCLSSCGGMDADITRLMARPELPVASITVQALLVSFAGAGVPGVARSKDEARALAERIYTEACAGADFVRLMKQFSDDPGPGQYPLTKSGREGLPRGLGNVGFRLAVGEIGVSPWHAADSPYGWHVVRRIE